MRKLYLRSFTMIIPIMVMSVCLFISGCGKDTISSFDIAGGPAALTLKEFARQANVEIVFDTQRLENITTKPIHGRLHHGEALRQMLAGSSCIVEEDPSTGAFAITLAKSP